jgi:quinol monooxygenase YgiN
MQTSTRRPRVSGGSGAALRSLRRVVAFAGMTKAFFPLAFGVMAMALAMTGAANAAETAGPVYIVAYFEAAPTDIAKVAAEVRQLVAASRKHPGNLVYDAFQEIGRPSRFAIFDGWQDMAAREAHRNAAATVAFRDRIQPLLVGPLEIREHTGFSIAGQPMPDGSGAVYALTHVDVFPAGKDQAAALVTSLAEANRKLPGNLWFEVLQVIGHPNHFTLVQGWRDRHAFDASLMAASTRDFRQKLTPLEGALYDERIYHALH